jgi:O-antigen ligase
LAILAGVLRLGAFRETWFALALVGAALGSVVLGALQIASPVGATTPWYIYPITNEGVAVGFFANANHMAILLVSTIPFLVALYGSRGDRRSADRKQVSAGKIAVIGGALMVLLVGIALSRSLAGIALGAAVLVASGFVRVGLDQRRGRWGLAVAGVGGLMAIAAMIASPVQNNLTTAGVEKDYSSRYTSFSNSSHALTDYFPVGSGIGSFPTVYPSYENPAWVDRWYVNHVHNDYIELGLETGLPGILLLAAFLLWWTQRTVVIWRSSTIDYFARAATITSAALLLHSAVDFPLRTTSLSSLFAFCIALMIGMRRRADPTPALQENSEGMRHLSIN